MKTDQKRTELEDDVLSRQEIECINKRKSPSSAVEGTSHKEPFYQRTSWTNLLRLSGSLEKLRAFALDALVTTVIYQRQVLRLINTRNKPSLNSMEGCFGVISIMVQSPQVPLSDSFLYLACWDWINVMCASLAVAMAVWEACFLAGCQPLIPVAQRGGRNPLCSKLGSIRSQEEDIPTRNDLKECVPTYQGRQHCSTCLQIKMIPCYGQGHILVDSIGHILFFIGATGAAFPTASICNCN